MPKFPEVPELEDRRFYCGKHGIEEMLLEAVAFSLRHIPTENFARFFSGDYETVIVRSINRRLIYIAYK